MTDQEYRDMLIHGIILANVIINGSVYGEEYVDTARDAFGHISGIVHSDLTKLLESRGNVE